MLSDLRFALRGLRRAPGFTAVAAVTLALGIGANSAIFSVAWQILLKPLPFPHADRLVLLWEAFGPERRTNPVTPGTFLDWQREGGSFQAIAAYNRHPSSLNLTGAGEPAELDIAYVTEGFFSVLGLNALEGRPILPADASTDAPLLVLAEHTWRERFGASPAILGRTVRLHGEPFEVIGVMPDSAALGSMAADGWVRMAFTADQARVRQAHYLQVIARLRPGVTLAQADDEARRIAERAYARFAAAGVAESGRATAFREHLAGGVRPALLVLLAGAGLVLLIAGANVSGLQLTRQVGRRRDLAIQAALGASRARQIRLQLAEAAILAVPAAAAGLILGAWILVVIGAAAPPLAGLNLDTTPGPMVVAYTFALSVLAGLACAVASLSGGAGAAPALLATRDAFAGRAASRLRTALVGAQVALSVLVLVAAALLVESLVRVLRVNPGFEFDSGLVVNIDLPQGTYADEAARGRFFSQAIDRVTGLAGIEGACAMTSAPLVRRPGSMTWVPEDETRLVASDPVTVSPGCFSVLRIPMLRGRTFTDREREAVVIVSRRLGERLFGAGDPVGRRIHMGLPDGRLFTIVGVAGDIRKLSLESAPGVEIWLPDSLPFYPPRQLVVKTSVPPGPLAARVRAVIRELDPDLPVSRIETMAALRDDALAGRRFSMLLLLGYGIIGLALCAVGVYGLLGQAIGQRTREIGVRMALGARPSEVVRQVVFSAGASVAAGCAAGAGAAALLSRFVRSLLFHVSPTDPLVYGAVAALVLAVAALAAYLPARRAARIDPVQALRADC